jgi:antitoxin CptB
MPTQNAGGNELLWRQRRARYRAWHRGTREMDLILGNFADSRVAGMDDAALTEFEELLEEADTDLLSWLTDQTQIPADANEPLLKAISTHHSGWVTKR